MTALEKRVTEENTMTKVIFLDIDGVLNSITQSQSVTAFASDFWNDMHQTQISEGSFIDKEKVKLLARLVERTSAKVILHSGWRFWFNQKLEPITLQSEQLTELLKEQGVSIDGRTPDLTTEEIRTTKRFSLVKAEEILLWLKEHEEVTKWVVLDDLDLHNAVVAQHQIMPNQSKGLTLKDMEKAERILCD